MSSARAESGLAYAPLGPPATRTRASLPRWLQGLLGNLALVLAVVILVYAGIFDFHTWSQVDDLWAFRFTPEAVSQHPHYYRYLVVYPGFLLTEWGGEKMLPLYISLFMIGGLILIRKMTEDLGFRVCAAALLAYLPAHFFMNGRGVISWAAWVAAIYIIYRAEGDRWRWRDAIFAGVALLGASVSTGSFAILYGIFAVTVVRNALWKKTFIGVVALAAPLMYFSSYFLTGIERSLAFFQIDGSWGIINMLNHGWGSLIQQSWTFAATAVFLGVLSPFIIHYMLKRFTTVETLILTAPVAGGAFGFTTLTLGVPSLIVVFGRRIGIGLRERRSTVAEATARAVASAPIR